MELPSAFRDLKRGQILLAQTRGPVRHQLAVRRPRDRIFGNPHLRGEIAADEIDIAARRRHADSALVELRQATEIRRQGANLFFTLAPIIFFICG